MFGILKKRKQVNQLSNVVADIDFGTGAGTMEYEGSTIRVVSPEKSYDDFIVTVNGKDIRLTKKDYLILYMYFGFIFKRYANGKL
jgi:hypothetical protein